MADSVLFEVDASQIVAKLHLAAVAAAGYKNGEFFINTGIKDDDPNATPEKPGKVTFDLNNTIGDYQLGFVTTLTYRKAFDLENTINDIQEYIAKMAGTKLSEKPDAKSQKEFDERKKYLLNLFNTYGIKIDDKKKFDTIEGIKEIREQALKEIGESDKEKYEKTLGDAKQYAIKQIDGYMKVFAGADNSKPVSESDLGMVDLPENAKDSTSSGLVKSFEIQPATEAEKAKMVEQAKIDFNKDPNKENVRQKVCFYVLYSIDVDK